MEKEEVLEAVELMVVAAAAEVVREEEEMNKLSCSTILE